MIQPGLFPATSPKCRDFDGETFVPKVDAPRLGKQMQAVFHIMKDGAWRTLAELSLEACAPEASVSARLRDLRKVKFGEHEIERRRRGNAKRGLFEYRMGDV